MCAYVFVSVCIDMYRRDISDIRDRIHTHTHTHTHTCTLTRVKRNILSNNEVEYYMRDSANGIHKHVTESH